MVSQGWRGMLRALEVGCRELQLLLLLYGDAVGQSLGFWFVRLAVEL